MINLEQYREKARRAYTWVSFSPGKRGDEDLKELESHLKEVREEINASQLTDDKKDDLYSWYESKLINLQLSAWEARSRCLNSMITGPAKFPVKRAEKASNNANNKERILLEHWNCDISKLIAKNLPEGIRANIKEQADIKAIDEYLKDCINHAHCYTNTLFQSKIERLINAGKLGAAQYAIDKAKEHKIFTERNKIFKLFDMAKAKAAEPQEIKKNQEQIINGVRVVENIEINRLQIFFDEKPDCETIRNLKSNGWHWSPKNKAWQRQLTPNAKNSLNLVLKGF